MPEHQHRNTHEHPHNNTLQHLHGHSAGLASQVIVNPEPSQVIVFQHGARPGMASAAVIVRPPNPALTPVPTNGFYLNPHAPALFFTPRPAHALGHAHVHSISQVRVSGQVHGHPPTHGRSHSNP